MSASVRMYPVLKTDAAQDAGFVPEVPELYYHGEDGRCMMDLRDNEGNGLYYSAVISDPRCAWEPESHELHLRQAFSLQNTRAWFGPEGVVAGDAVLGLALHWSSTGSEQQGTVQTGEIKKVSVETQAEGCLSFGKGFLKGSIIVELLVYLKKAGVPRSDEKHLCNATGTVLGTLMHYELYIDGNGSTFPIVTESNPDKPLWTVDYNPDDMMTDPFDYEHVAIVLNSAHRDYHLISQDSSDYCLPFFSEVLSDALVVMTAILKDSAREQGVWDDILAGQNYDPGSVAAAMNYFVTKLEWDTDDLQKLSESVHKFIDRNLKGEMK